MSYVIWVIGVLLAIYVSVKFTIKKEQAGQFAE